MQFIFDDEFTTLEEALATRPIGQIRPGISKEYLLRRIFDPSKGSFRRATKKLTSLAERTKWLLHWRTPLVLLPIGQFERPEGIYLTYPNLDDITDLTTEPHHEHYTGRNYRAVVRKALNKLNYVLPDANLIYEMYAEDLVLALVQLWILWAGDVGICCDGQSPSNMLVQMNNKRVHIVNFEQTRGKDRDDEIFYFSSQPAAKYNWIENVRPHYRKVTAIDCGHF